MSASRGSPFSVASGSRPLRRMASLLLCAMATMAPIAPAGAAASGYGLGRAPAPDEIKAWDIDVRPDFAGLPKGSGSVARGQEIWDAKCASCHGVFGESNEFFNPIIGGTTPDEAAKGMVKSLTTSQLQRTTMMKLSSLSTMWDYIRRAMPWTAPKSLMVDDVYAVTAYILHLADLVPGSFVLSDANIRDTERLLPNRNGMTRDHGLWSIRGKPDVRNIACMKDCAPAPVIESAMPEHARNAHGNLADQNRLIGAVRGADTSRPAPPTQWAERSVARQVVQRSADHADSAPSATHPALALSTRQGCTACHAPDRRIVGPSFSEIAARHAANATSSTQLAQKIRAGGSGQWGAIPMPAQSQLTAADASALAEWIIAGAPGK